MGKNTMSHLQKVIVLLALAPVLALALHNDCGSNENSYLWKVHISPPVYLFGTMHVAYTKLWEYIPENAKTAFSSSEDLCVELRLSDSTTASQLAECQGLPRGQTINEVISPEVHQRISTYLQRIGTLLPQWLASTTPGFLFNRQTHSQELFNAIVSGWERKRPIWVLLMLASLTEENIRLRKVPLLDVFLDNAAERMGKRVQAVESVQDQCRPLNRLSNEQVELALRVQLDYLEPLAFDSSGPHGDMERNVQTYRCGDFEQLVFSQSILPLPPLENVTNVTAQELSILRDVDRFLTAQLVVRRNRRITKRLDELLHSQRNITTFFALGAGHFLGAKSVIARLQKKGYTVEHIPATTDIEGPSLPSNIIALGHPDSVPRLMTLQPQTEAPGRTLPTLSPQTLVEIWEEIINSRQNSEPTSPSTQEPTATTARTPQRSARELHLSNTQSHSPIDIKTRISGTVTMTTQTTPISFELSPSEESGFSTSAHNSSSRLYLGSATVFLSTVLLILTSISIFV